MTVKVYGRPGCGQCETSKIKLHRAGIAYEYLLLDDHIEELKGKFNNLPKSLPYIVSDENLYMFNQLDTLIKELKT